MKPKTCRYTDRMWIYADILLEQQPKWVWGPALGLQVWGQGLGGDAQACRDQPADISDTGYSLSGG